MRVNESSPGTGWQVNELDGLSINFACRGRCRCRSPSGGYKYPLAVYFEAASRKKERMASPTTPPPDLLDLKLLPAWVKEPAQPNAYADFAGEEERPERRQDRHGRPPPRGPRSRGPKDRHERKPRVPQRRDHRPAPVAAPPAVSVRFLPYPPALENVVAQIKSGSVAYSIFALARLFLEKPERYNVRLNTTDDSVMHQVGETGAVAVDKTILENGAFADAKEDFYDIEVTQSEPIKGNFTNVARDRLSGTLLGPTNHHAYQPRLRSLYEQRFSRRMSFAEYQRQIEIVSDPEVVERWKEEARNITTFTAKNAEPPATFTNAAEAERHFRQNYLPGLLRSGKEFVVGGLLSRQLADRPLRNLIEDAWSRETRSPSQMMQELAGHLRQAGLNIFRHRRGMLFVSPIRARAFKHEQTGVSPSVNAILETLTATPRINRKELAEKLLADLAGEEAETKKLSLASDLHWLVSEGYVIEFNDGSLDLPRTKPAKEKVVPAAESTEANIPAPAATTTPSDKVGAIDSIARESESDSDPFSEPPQPSSEQAEIGGS